MVLLIILSSYAGEPSNKEKLILALGLGSSGQDINSNGCRRRRSLTNNIIRTNSSVVIAYYRPTTLCRRKRTTCEKKQVCSGFGM